MDRTRSNASVARFLQVGQGGILPQSFMSRTFVPGIVHLPFFILAVLLLNATPGPDTAYIVGRSVAQGRSAGVVSAFGISAGCCVHTLACAFGLTALLAASAGAFMAIKILGALYLIYLGARLLMKRNEAATQIEPARHRPGADGPLHRSLRRLFLQGFWTNVLNPKVVLFFVSFFPQFVAVDTPSKALPFLLLGLIFVVVSTMWNSAVALLAATITARVRGAPGLQRWVDRVVGCAFVGLGLRLASLRR